MKAKFFSTTEFFNLTRPFRSRRSVAFEVTDTPARGGDFRTVIYVDDGGKLRPALVIYGESFADGMVRVYAEPDTRFSHEWETVTVEPYTSNSPLGFRIESKPERQAEG